jgi:hypothetical protein
MASPVIEHQLDIAGVVLHVLLVSELQAVSFDLTHQAL